MAKVSFEPTPNPDSYKFILDHQISNESIEFTDPLEANRSPLASKIFGFPWCAGVFIGPDFVSIKKLDWVDWDVIAEPLCQLIAEHIENGEPVLLSTSPEGPQPQNSATENDIHPDDPEVVKQIKHILNSEIRPAVAMDGGDIVFHKYEDQILYVFMRGACAGCPSSTMTLKAGIEVRLKEAINELKEVVSV